MVYAPPQGVKGVDYRRKGFVKTAEMSYFTLHKHLKIRKVLNSRFVLVKDFSTYGVVLLPTRRKKDAVLCFLVLNGCLVKISS
ncbi:unnamed protein product [Schistosoma mansoni]|uniref:Smp_202370 n=1 Tax=Schistosoma mansoni TaxID=6183 RepID=G4LW76_SCHMA|nr:unnamed protein product [Schistosoma mansoni]|eukprot:XP_018645522.1 unnamed protein product [Schistosoma mansoni]